MPQPPHPAHDSATLAFYQGEAAAYAERSRGHGAHPALASFLAALPRGAHILDFGCGAGVDSKAMLDQGFEVSLYDGCAELAAEAERLTGRPVRVALFEELDDDAVYDAVWASASLLHVPRAGLPGIFRRLHRALKPGGRLYASFKASGSAAGSADGSAIGSNDGRDGLGRYYNYPSEQDLRRCLAGTGWTELRVETGEGGGYDRKRVPWITLHARKAATGG